MFRIFLYFLLLIAVIESRSLSSESDGHVSQNAQQKSPISLGFAPKLPSSSQDQDIVSLLKRQHFSFGFGPGGKRSLDLKIPEAADVQSEKYSPRNLLIKQDRLLGIDDDTDDKDKRQHWSTGWAPGGKRSAPSEETLRRMLWVSV